MEQIKSMCSEVHSRSFQNIPESSFSHLMLHRDTQALWWPSWGRNRDGLLEGLQNLADIFLWGADLLDNI